MNKKNCIFATRLFGVFFGLFTWPSLHAQSKLIMAGTAVGFEPNSKVLLMSPSNPGYQGPEGKINNGSFTLEAELPMADLYLLVVGNSPVREKNMQYQVFLDNEVVEISINKAQPEIQVIVVVPRCRL